MSLTFSNLSWIYLSIGRVFWVHHCSKTCISLVHHSILVFLYHLSLKFLHWDFVRSIIYISLRVKFSSVGYYLRGHSRVRYLLRFVNGAWSQKSKMVDWNHNPIVLLEGLVWKPWISETSSLWLKLEESGCRPGCTELL